MGCQIGPNTIEGDVRFACISLKNCDLVHGQTECQIGMSSVTRFVISHLQLRDSWINGLWSVKLGYILVVTTLTVIGKAEEFTDMSRVLGYIESTNERNISR